MTSTSLLTSSNDGSSSSTSTGKLSATILSVYDIPPPAATTTTTGGANDNGTGSSSSFPSYVSMSIMGKEVKTGKPSSKHKVMNNFRFVGTDGSASASSSSNAGPATNILSLSAPLSVLYPTTVTFRVVFESSETLVARCKLSSTLRINQQQWLILNLFPESSFQGNEKGKGEREFDATKSTSSSKAQETSSTSTTENQPTLRLKLCLSGPYRTEIGAIHSLAQSWFHIVDSISSTTNTTLSSIAQSLPLLHQFPPAKILLVPTVPLAAASVALVPIALGILVLGLPFFLPILVVLLTVLVSTFLVGSGVYFSSSTGRESASIVLGPLYSTFLSTTAGQRLIYQTGPRPSPPALIKMVLPTDMVGKLILSLVIDFIGSCSYLLPVVGEGFDLAWAPIQTIFLMAMYDDRMPGLKYVSFIEEILPFTDLLPSGTLGWVREFSPLLMEEGLKKVEDMRVVLRGEREAMRQQGVGR
mmetsp:Transcript_26759/g.40185  ORF Transcript_26759/g.40185 Transcript_26759/m.40185 type:complete len:473 (-) Transcript_26759:12-1430(-)